MDDFIGDIFDGAFDDNVAYSLETSKLKIISEIKTLILSLEDNVKFKEVRDYKNNLSSILSYLLEVNELSDLEESGAPEVEVMEKAQSILDRVIPIKNDKLGNLSEIINNHLTDKQKIEKNLNNTDIEDLDDLFDF